MIRAACHCGAVRFEISEPPDWVLDCNCTICRRYGAMWSYYHAGPDQSKLLKKPDPAATEAYVWGDRQLGFHRCKTCGCVTHWASLDPESERMGVNARLMDPEVLRPLRIRKLDGAVTGKYFR